MKTKQIVRAWKDPEYRARLSESERSLLPENPAGQVELKDSDLGYVTGGFDCTAACTATCSANCDPDFTTFIGSCVTYPQQCP